MISKRHWILAGTLAVSVHAAAFYAVFYSPSKGGQAAGQQGIEFDLGMMGDMGVAEQTTASQEEVKEAEESLEEVVEETPPEPVVEPEPIVEPEPVVVKQESAIVVPKKKTSKPIPKQKPKEKPKKEPELKVEEKAPTPKIVKAPIKKVAPPSAANQKVTTGTANAQNNGGNEGAKVDYFSKLAAVLASKKRYPRASRRRGEEGIVTLYFIVYANGSVSDVEIRKTSGSKRLDRAVLDMIKKATPLPRFSKEMTESQLSVTLPVSFKLSDL